MNQILAGWNLFFFQQLTINKSAFIYRALYALKNTKDLYGFIDRNTTRLDTNTRHKHSTKQLEQLEKNKQKKVKKNMSNILKTAW